MEWELSKDPKGEARAAMRRSDSFWVAFEKSVHRTRYLMTVHAHYQHLYRLEASRSPFDTFYVVGLNELVHKFHDLLLCEISNIRTLSERAKSAEMSARVWHEESTETPEEGFVPSSPYDDEA